MQPKNSSPIDKLEWSSVTFVRELRAKEKTNPASLSQLESAYLEILDSRDSKEFAALKKDLTAHFKKGFERDAIEKAHRDVVAKLRAARQLRPSSADIKLMAENGLVGLSAEEAAIMKATLANHRNLNASPGTGPSA